MLNHKFWRNLIILAWGASPGLPAQTAEAPLFFWAYMRSTEQPENWVVADLRTHVLRDASGALDSGGGCVRLRYSLRDPMTLTALRIHRVSDGGVALQAVFPSTIIRGQGSVMAGSNDKIQVRLGDQQALEAFRRFLADPFGHYVVVATQEQPEGAFRGPILRTEYTVLMALANADPAIPSERRARAALEIDALLARDSSGNVVFGEVLFQGAYHYPAQVTFTGLHLRSGPDGSGPALISAPVTTLASAATGSGELPSLFTQILPQNETAFRTLLEMVRAPENIAVTLEAGAQPEDIVRGKLRRTDRMTFQLQYDARHVVPPPDGLNSWSAAAPALFTLRREDGSIAAAVFLNHWQFRLPEPCTRQSVQVRRARAGANGPVAWTVSSTVSALSTGHEDMAGFAMTHFDEGDLNNFVNDLVSRPEEYYIELRTDKRPEGAVRAQFGAMTALPTIDAVGSANLDPASKTLAPGALFTIFGRNLAKLGTDLRGWEGRFLPESLNSVAVGTGVHRALLLFVSPAQITAQLPFETPAGTRQLAVNNGIGLSNVAEIQVAAVAPALFDGVILKRADNSLVSAMSPAEAGDVIVVYLTGMGQTTPPMATGQIVDATRAFATVPVTVTVGGRDAEVLSSTAAPGFSGIYQVALRVPAGAGPGNRVPLLLKAGAAISNTLSIAVR